jgi:hypothetical protein
MRRFFFIFLFALTALFFTACSSSDDDDNGGGGSTLSYPDPKGINGFPGSYKDTSRTITYEVADQAALDAYENAWEEKFGTGTCTPSGHVLCTYTLTVGGVAYDLKADLGTDGSGDFLITLEIYNDSSPENLPSDSIFGSEFPPVKGTVSKNTYNYFLTFADSGLRSTYVDAYKKALTDNGFTLEAGSLSRYTKTVGETTLISAHIEDENPGFGLDIDVDIQSLV